jgi:hypothetical protein
MPKQPLDRAQVHTIFAQVRQNNATARAQTTWFADPRACHHVRQNGLSEV